MLLKGGGGHRRAEGRQDRTRALAAKRIQTSNAGCVAPPTKLPLQYFLQDMLPGCVQITSHSSLVLHLAAYIGLDENLLVPVFSGRDDSSIAKPSFTLYVREENKNDQIIKVQ